MKGKVTYRQQYTRCGKQRCRKCKEGPGHGPYWYAYYSENGRTISKYIGIHAPADLMASQERTPALVSQSNASDQPLIRIFVLGHFRIEMRHGNEWVPVTNRIWQRRRARTLLGCLLSNSSRRLGREQAMESLWPDVDIDTAANRLNGAVHEVRQVLEPQLSRPAASRMLRLERNMLILADASVIWVDAEAFEKSLNKVHTLTDPAQVEQVLEETLLLYGGEYLLEELYSEWAAPRRESLRRSWMGILLKLAELRANRGALTSAIEPLDRLLTCEPTHETAVRRLMELLTQLDRRGEAFQVYQRLVATLRREYDSDPLPETTALYQAMRQGTYQAPRPVLPPSVMPNVAPPDEWHPATPVPPSQAASFPRPILQLVRHNQSKLVGRDEERNITRQFLLTIEQLTPEENGRKIPHFMLLLGESGIGKTRLAEELSYEANQSGWSVVWAHGYEQEATVPYRPWAEIFRALLKDIDPSLLLSVMQAQVKQLAGQDARSPGKASSLMRERLARMSTLVPELSAFDRQSTLVGHDMLSSTPEQDRLHLWEAASTILGVLSRSTPLLVVLDDLHWTDDTSLALLAYIVRHMQQERIAIVATCRDAELTPGSNLSTLINDLRREQTVLTLPVKPLNEIYIGSLVSHLPEHIVKGIQRQAGGNPFFAEELARVSASGQQYTGGDGKPQRSPGTALELEMPGINVPTSMTTATPESIQAVLDRRLSKLSRDCRVLLGKAAVLGGSFALSQITFLAGEQDANEESILDLLEEALHAGLLTEEGAGSRIIYHFWHPLIVNHLYERQSAARRAQLHRKAAHALLHLHQGEEEEVAATITHHLIRGGSDIKQVGYYAELAGNRAFSLYAYSETEYYYRLAVDTITSDVGTNADGQRVAPSDRRPEQDIEDALHLASILERIAECNMVHGNFEEARHLYERVLNLRSLHCSRSGNAIGEEEALRQALIWREIGRAWSENGNIEEAARCYDFGQRVMIEAGVTSGAAWACLHLSHGNLSWRLGDNETARRHGQEALDMLKPIMRQQEQEKQALPITSTELPTRTALAMIGSPYELGRCYELLGIVAATLSQFAEALENLHQALAIFERHDLVTALTLAYGNLAAVHANKAEYDTASMYFQRALEMARRDNNLPMMAFVYGNLGETAARRGRLVEAEEQTRQSLTIAERINDAEQCSWTHIVHATILYDLGEMPAALSHIRRGLKIGRAIKSVLCVGMALIALGEWRIIRSIQVGQMHFIRPDAQDALRSSGGYILLNGAKLALQRALALEGLSTEAATEGRLTLASALYVLGELDAAKQAAMQSLYEAEQHELLRVTARSQRLLGRILAAQGMEQEADSYAERALAMFARHEMRLDYARALHGYGVTLLQRSIYDSDTYQRGLRRLREARDIFNECGASIDLAWVERILSDPTYENVAT